MHHHDKFSQLVENAFDFLDKALGEFEISPKYSVIHFYAAVELFLKARLLAEHWSLVISKRQDADLRKFQVGEFQSVTLEEAADRLEKIVQSPLSKIELGYFRELGRHRNRMVHFFHEVTSEGSAKVLRQQVAIEQLKAWYVLNRLLADRWSAEFSQWKPKLKSVTDALKRHREYLKVAFDNVQEKLEGKVVKSCISCGYPSAEIQGQVGLLKSSECLVCELAIKYVAASCPKCDHSVVYVDEGFSQCPNCGTRLEPDDLAEVLDDDQKGTKEYFESGMPAHCRECDGFETVVHHSDKCVCSNCLQIFVNEEMHQCGWCGDLNAGDMDDSFTFGCVACGGKAGDLRDD